MLLTGYQFAKWVAGLGPNPIIENTTFVVTNEPRKIPKMRKFKKSKSKRLKRHKKTCIRG